MKSLVCGLLLALASLSSVASPEREARHQFCYATASTSYEVAIAKLQGLGVQEFETGLAELIAQLKGQMPANMLEEIKHFLREGYASDGDPAATARRIYDACMNKKVT